MKSRVVSFCAVCVVTVVVVVLFVILDLPTALNTPILQQQVTVKDQDTRQWVHQDKHNFIKLCKVYTFFSLVIFKCILYCSIR